MRKPDRAKIDLVRDEILRASMELFQTYGLEKTTMENIAEAAGKGKSTLYYYFKKKEDVFHAVAELERLDIMETLAKSIRWAHSAEEKLRLFFKTRDNAIRCKAKLYPLIFKGSRKHITLFHKIQRENNTAEVKMFKEILLEGIKSGEFANIKAQDCDSIAISGITALHGLYMQLLLDGKVPSVEDRMNAVLDVFIRGLK